MSKTVFITGASAGFGTACARHFAANGWRLVLAARRGERLADLREELGGAAVHVVTLDVRDREAVLAAVAELPPEFATVDLLINNAGLALGLEPAQRCSLDDWETMIDTNIKGLTFCTRALLPGMVERNCGHIVNIGSTAGSWPYPGGNVYGGTKAFVAQFSRNLRADLLGTKVRVTTIAPGMAESEFSIVRFTGDAEQAANVYKGTEPLTPEDIAELVFFVNALPERININSLEVMPTCQAWGPLAVHREK
jgi:3-hydroxy acid dehydrogenase / malonic semialdehyde reductase